MPDTQDQPVIAPDKPDWPLIKAAYLRGTPLREISATFNVSIHQVRNRAWRAGWRHESLPDATEQPAAMQDLIREWITNMALSLQASSKWWVNSELVPLDLKEAKDLESARQCHIDSGRKLFGLDKSDANGSGAWNKGNVIDVTATTTVATLKPNDKQS